MKNYLTGFLNVGSERINQHRWLFFSLVSLVICCCAFVFFCVRSRQGVAEFSFSADRANFLRIYFASGSDFIKPEIRTFYFKKGENSLTIPNFQCRDVRFIKIFPADNQSVRWNMKSFQYTDKHGKCLSLTPAAAKSIWGTSDTAQGLLEFLSTKPEDNFIIPLDRLSVTQGEKLHDPLYASFFRAVCVTLFSLILLFTIFYPKMKNLYPEIAFRVEKYRNILNLTAGAALVVFLLKYTVFTGYVTAIIFMLYIFRKLLTHQEESAAPVKSNFDWGMHYFRAFAIICVAGEHFFGRFRADFANSFTAFCTAYFLFISGYLAQYLFNKRPDPALTYYKKKALNVLLPYLIFSVLILGAAYWWQSEMMNFWIAFNPSLSHNYWSGVVKSIVYDSGRTLTGYWYIPFVATLFAVTPYLCRAKDNKFIFILFFSGFLLCIVPQRSGIDANGVATNISGILKFYYRYSWYFFPYILGMAFARYRNTLEPFFHKIFWACLILGIFIGGNRMGWWPLSPNMVPNVINLQKYCFIVCAIILLELIKDTRVPLLDLFANYSFTIFFIHGFFMRDMVSVGNLLQDHVLLSLNGCAFWGTVLFLGLMLYLAFMLKKIIGKHAKYIIGC